jgi:hypothetical protein
MLCLTKNIIDGNLTTTRDPQSFLLTFNNTWNEYFSKYADNFRVKVSKLANTDYDCKIKQDKSFEYIFKISCAINKNISEGEILKLTLENLPNETEFSDITIRRKEYTVPMKAFITCPENFTYNIGSYKLFI